MQAPLSLMIWTSFLFRWEAEFHLSYCKMYPRPNLYLSKSKDTSLKKKNLVKVKVILRIHFGSQSGAKSFFTWLKLEKVQRERQREFFLKDFLFSYHYLDRLNRATQAHLKCSTVPEIHYLSLVIVHGPQFKMAYWSHEYLNGLKLYWLHKTIICLFSCLLNFIGC